MIQSIEKLLVLMRRTRSYIFITILLDCDLALSILFLVSSILLYFPFGSGLEFPILQCTILVEVEPADALRDVAHAGLFICNL